VPDLSLAGGMPSELSPWLLILLAAAFLGGFVDSIVGGGGLIQVPVLFSFFPEAAPAILIGTNKLVSAFGTSAAAVQYVRRIRFDWSTVILASIAALLSAFLGAWTVTHIPARFMRGLVPFVLLGVAVYMLRRREFGLEPALDQTVGWKQRWMGAVIGGAVGFYDGFFGPGSGSFLMFGFVRCFGLNFLGASAPAKVVNVACNLAAISWFAWSGNMFLGIGLAMGLFNIFGSVVGSRLALKNGAGFIRRIFLVVVGALILKTGYDAFTR